VHLSRVGVGELAQLQVDDQQRAQAAMEEEEIDTVPLISDTQPPLAA
jgi:hypothetical protein